ncbi:hypothetical protein ILUMI_00936, partial [Ignelater luminosus]
VLFTLLNVFTCILYADFISLLLPSSMKKKWGVTITRIITICIGIIGIALVFIAEKFGSLFEMSYLVVGFLLELCLGYLQWVQFFLLQMS